MIYRKEIHIMIARIKCDDILDNVSYNPGTSVLTRRRVMLIPTNCSVSRLRELFMM